MRTVMMTLVVASLLAAPSLGMIYFNLTADGPVVGQVNIGDSYGDLVRLAPGATTTIHLWGMGTTWGLFAFAGSVVAGASDPMLLTTNANSMVFSPLYNPSAPFSPKPGTAGSNGGRDNFGSQQTDWGNPHADYGRTAYIELCSYTVTAASSDVGIVTLRFVPGLVSGYKPIETDKSSVLCPTIALVGIQVIPEPMTLALLALGGRVVVRRRRT
jgi:hypothetical protein